MNPSVNVREESNGDLVRSNTSTVETTAETTVPVIAIAEAAKIARNSGLASAAAYEASPLLVLRMGQTVRAVAQQRKRFAPGHILVRMTAFAAQRQDLGMVRFAWSPAWETHLAVRMFIDPRGRPYHESWHAAMAGEAARLHLTALLAVNPLRGSVPDFLTPPPRSPAPRFRDQLDQVRATPPEQVTEDLRRCRRTLLGNALGVVDKMLTDPAAARDRFADQMQAAWERLVAPFWPSIQAVLDADVAHRSRQLTGQGLRPMLEGIDARISWSDGTVVVCDGMDIRVELRGRGLLLMPSAYIWPAVAAVVDEPWQPTIVYPARGIADLWQQAAPPPDALARLLGRTRALLLVRLDRPASTATLAARHGLSPSGTSKHLTVMRDAGLVAGARHGHEIRYARTRLGTELSRAAAARGP
jgi:DNA-binding transcriptional ArsR family regulator